jgi:hypothetical protein
MATPDVDTIRARMARIRSRAQGKAVRLSRETKQFLDWKHYVRLFPWGVVGAAAIAGYLLVPARKVVPVEVSPSSNINPPPPPPQRERPGLMSSFMRMAMNTATRTAIAYAGQALGNYVAQIVNNPVSASAEGEPDALRHESAARGYRSEFSHPIG